MENVFVCVELRGKALLDQLEHFQLFVFTVNFTAKHTYCSN